MTFFPIPLIGILAGFFPMLALFAGGRGAPAGSQATLELTSSSIPSGEIPRKFTCDEADTSPALTWSAAPAGTQSLALIVTDPDAPRGSFTHWILYDIPPGTRQLQEGMAKQAQLPDGSRQGRNDFGDSGYRGPCPPGGSPHRYIFSLYALDSKLNLPPGATKKQVEDALKGHVLAHGELTGKYGR